MDEHLEEATADLDELATKLDGVFQTSGREGLNQYTTNDVAVLFQFKQHEEDRLIARIEAGNGSELDLLRQTQLAEQLEELHEYLWERSPEIEIGD